MFSRSNSAAEQLTAVWNLCHPQAALNALITHQFDSPRALTHQYALAGGYDKPFPYRKSRWAFSF